MASFRWLAAGALWAIPLLANAIVWPGASPCNGTLQACINSASPGSTVEVASNAVIDENLSFGIPLTLRAASGYSPTLAVDRAILPSASTSGTYAVEGFTLQRGFVSVTHNAGNATIVVRRVRVLAPVTSGSAEISVYSNASSPLVYELSENDVDFAWDTYDGGIHAAIQVLRSGSGNTDGRIHDNRVNAGGGWSTGILVTSQDNVHTARLYDNWIRGGASHGSIDLRQGSLIGSGGGSLNADVLNNVVTPLVHSGDAHGIDVDAYLGSVNLQAFNNTVTGAYTGINVYVAPGSMGNGRIANNLLSGNSVNIELDNSGSGTISNDHNLIFNGIIVGTVAGPGTVTTDPKLRGAPGNPWLNATSPAIDAADSVALDSVLTTAAIARVDGAGLRRFKGGSNLADIGALEFGDITFLHRVHEVTPSAFSRIDHPAINGLAFRYPQITSSWNPDGAISCVYNPHPDSIWYDGISHYWNMRNEDLAVLPEGASFNIFSPAYGNGNFDHVVTAGNLSGYTTALSAIGALHGHPDRILLVTRDSLDPDGNMYGDAHPLGAFYFTFGGPGEWYIAHLDHAPMVAGGGHHVYWQEPSANAFVHTATAGNSAGDYTVLDHPLLNGRSCARFHVTQSIGGAVFNAHPVGVYYFGGRWAIFNEDLSAIPAGTNFYVVVDAQQVFECSDVIFANGLE